METIQGKTSLYLNATEFSRRIAGYTHIHLDLGTGDGRFARQMAAQHPRDFFIGLDSCRENLREHSRAGLPNALYVIASAQALPAELNGLVSQITINFPWGSLLASLLEADESLVGGLLHIAQPGADLTIRLNGGALAEQGWALDNGAEQVSQNLASCGFKMRKPACLGPVELRSCPSTWARKLAVGRDPRGWLLRAAVPTNAKQESMATWEQFAFA